MSDAVILQPLAYFAGYVSVEEVAPQGMITLRGDLTGAVLTGALQAVGLNLPGVRRIVQTGAGSVAWMSPDEVLLLVPLGEVQAVMSHLEQALAGTHFLAVDVSDARATFRVQGQGAREVIAKLCPVDLDPAAFQAGDMRRTRAAQVAVAIWVSGPQEVSLMSFRSVGAHVFDLLRNAALPGSQIYPADRL